MRANPSYLLLAIKHGHRWKGDEGRAHGGHTGIILCFALRSPNGHCRADDLKVVASAGKCGCVGGATAHGLVHAKQEASPVGTRRQEWAWRAHGRGEGAGALKTRVAMSQKKTGSLVKSPPARRFRIVLLKRIDV